MGNVCEKDLPAKLDPFSFLSPSTTSHLQDQPPRSKALEFLVTILLLITATIPSFKVCISIIYLVDKYVSISADWSTFRPFALLNFSVTVSMGPNWNARYRGLLWICIHRISHPCWVPSDDCRVVGQIPNTGYPVGFQSSLPEQINEPLDMPF